MSSFVKLEYNSAQLRESQAVCVKHAPCALLSVNFMVYLIFASCKNWIFFLWKVLTMLWCQLLFSTVYSSIIANLLQQSLFYVYCLITKNKWKLLAHEKLRFYLKVWRSGDGLSHKPVWNRETFINDSFARLCKGNGQTSTHITYIFLSVNLNRC